MLSTILKSPEKLLALLLYLIAVHSFSVGIMLMIQPACLMSFAGFGPELERFFPTQGGVFHIVMAVAYTMGANDLSNRGYMVIFSYTAKFIATVFLLTYYVALDPKWVILVSGIGDGLMGIIIYISYKNYLKKNTNGA